LTIPHRGTTSESTYFVTANVEPRRNLFQVEKIARLFIEILFDYRGKTKYLLHEFVVMPDHFHLILTPTGITLERAMQLKGGFSFQLNKNLKAKRDIWQPSFVDRRVRDSTPWATEFNYLSKAEEKRRAAGTPAPAVQTSNRQECLCHTSHGKKVAVHVQDRGDFREGRYYALDVHSADCESADGELVSLSRSAAYVISQRKLLSDMADVLFRS
jgi:putative transposase